MPLCPHPDPPPQAGEGALRLIPLFPPPPAGAGALRLIPLFPPPPAGEGALRLIPLFPPPPAGEGQGGGRLRAKRSQPQVLPRSFRFDQLAGSGIGARFTDFLENRPDQFRQSGAA